MFNEAGTLKATWKGASAPGGSFGSFVGDVAVDNSTNPLDEDKGDVYVAAPLQKAIDVFHPEADGKEHYVGRLEHISPSESFAFPSRLAVNDVNGGLVVVGDAGTFDIFEPAVLGKYAYVGHIASTPTAPLSETFNFLRSM